MENLKLKFKCFFLMDLIKNTIFFNGIIERAGNREFESIFEN